MSAGAPRVRALVNGTLVDTILHASITDNGSCKASHFELTAQASGDTSSDLWLNSLDERLTVTISIYSDWNDSSTTIFEGLADSMLFDPLRMIARIQGKDYSSILANSSFQDSFLNRTASEIARSIAGRHGFGSNISSTTALVGSYRSGNHNQMALNAYSHITSEWDLLIHLARSEGFELFVDGGTLVFAPAEALQHNYVAIDNSDVQDIRFSKNCQLSGQTTVVVKSWNSWTNRASLSSQQQAADQVPSALGSGANSATEFVLVKPNLAPADVERLAQSYSAALNKQTIGVEIAMPGEPFLRPGDVLTVGGSGTGFDMEYTIASVRRRFSSTAGYVQHVHGFANRTTSAAPSDASAS
jgi:phage protein D